ncbi:SIMPL domain-containing protein [Candidatus Woesearchaeota archaeon]|nr:SIMPL domain-containing protein [Candidatus Woesearchaeota archaeon]
MAQQTNTTAIIIVALIVFGVLGAMFLTNTSNQGNFENTISATGYSEMNVDPDRVVVYLNIETRDDSADDAKDENSRISEEVMTALRNLDINEEDIQTQNYQIYPEYDWSTNTQKIKGYVVTNSIKVELKDFDLVGEVVDKSVDAGALVSYISFELSTAKMNEYETGVIEEATKDAKSKAESIASGLGKQLGEIVSVSASDYNYQPYYLYERMDSSGGVAAEEAKDAATNINPSQLDVTATVNVVYKIK